MKVIVAGSRTVTSMTFVELAIKESKFEITELVSGGARGVDELGEVWAAFNHIPIKQFRAAWGFYGQSAGMIRNGEMAQYADALIAVWDGRSKGTKHMIWTAQHRFKLPTYVANVSDARRTPMLPDATTGDYS
jgi:hypothetical protein